VDLVTLTESRCNDRIYAHGISIEFRSRYARQKAVSWMKSRLKNSSVDRAGNGKTDCRSETKLKETE
jgi:hypothetical protein